MSRAAASRRRDVAIAVIVAALAAVACGSDATPTSSGPAPNKGTQIPTRTPIPSETSEGGGDTPAPTLAATDAPTEAPTSLPTVASRAVDCVLDAAFSADVTIPDNTQIEVGKPFVKTWRIANAGTCAWGAGSFRLTFVDGSQMGGPGDVYVGPTVPGGSAEVSVELVAPATAGTYRGDWRMSSDETGLFGAGLYVQIVAFDPAAPPPATATSAAEPTAQPVAVCPCSANVKDCGDFGTHAEAQACFDYCVAQGRGDIHKMDRDNDGLACETLP